MDIKAWPAVVPLMLLLLSACGSSGPAAPAVGPDVSRVSFLAEEELYPMGALTGPLGGDTKTGCLWVQTASGDGDRLPVRLHDDAAELDVSVQPPVIRDGSQVLAAFGDAVELGGGNGVSPPAPGCAELGAPFTGHSSRRVLPGAPPMLTLTDLRRACGPADGPELAGTLVVSGVPRQPLDLEVDGPDGTLLARVQLPAAEGVQDLALPLDPFKTLVPADALPEWNVRVSEQGQVLAQELVDLRLGPECG